MRKARWTKPLNFMIAVETHRKIKEITDLQEVSIAYWVRAAIEEKLDREEQAQGDT